MGIPVIPSYPMPAEADLPAAIPAWTADPSRAVLLIHDMQRYFLQPFPAGQEPVSALVPNVARLRDTCRELGVQVAYTAQPGGMTERQRGLLKDFWGPGMRVDPADRWIVDPVSPETDDWMITKWRYSAFFKSDLLRKMRDANRDQLVICGVYAHIGILATAIESFSNDIETFIVADAVAGFTRESHLMALNYAARSCAVVTFADEVLP